MFRGVLQTAILSVTLKQTITSATAAPWGPASMSRARNPGTGTLCTRPSGR